jgi:spermidine/putrescine transport system permease protein
VIDVGAVPSTAPAAPSDTSPSAAATAAGAGRSLVSWAQLAPSAVYFLAFFAAPVSFLVAYSFFTTENFDYVADFTFANYREAVTSEVFRAFFLRTFRLAAIISTIVVLVSFPFAYCITYVFPRKRQTLYFLVLVSLFGGYLVRIYAWRNILGRQGVLNQSLASAGLIDEPLRFFLNSEFAIVLASVNFLIPLGILPIFSAMQNVPPSLIEASRDLGASRLRTALTIVLPMSMRGVRAAFGFAFIAAAAEWVTPQLLGGTGDQMIGNQIAFQFGGGLDWPLGAALAITLVVAVLLILSVLFGLMRLLTR